jgi:hypothetical protein
MKKGALQLISMESKGSLGNILKKISTNKLGNLEEMNVIRPYDQN